jgi:hypothetical protein
MLSDAKEQHRAWELKQQFFQKKKPPPQQKKKPDFRPAAHQTPVLWTTWSKVFTASKPPSDGGKGADGNRSPSKPGKGKDGKGKGGKGGRGGKGGKYGKGKGRQSNYSQGRSQ